MFLCAIVNKAQIPCQVTSHIELMKIMEKINNFFHQFYLDFHILIFPFFFLRFEILVPTSGSGMVSIAFQLGIFYFPNQTLLFLMWFLLTESGWKIIILRLFQEGWDLLASCQNERGKKTELKHNI